MKNTVYGITITGEIPKTTYFTTRMTPAEVFQKVHSEEMNSYDTITLVLEDRKFYMFSLQHRDSVTRLKSRLFLLQQELPLGGQIEVHLDRAEINTKEVVDE